MPQQKPKKKNPTTNRYVGSAWGGGSLVGYKTDPKTGEVTWVARPINWTFTRNYDLSKSVWDSVEQMENKIYAVVEFGVSNGQDPLDTVRDLETFVKYRDGGARVANRWGQMFTKTDKNIAEGWQREFIKENYPNTQWGTPDAKRLIDTPQAQDWIDRNSFGKNGRKLLPPQVKAWQSRIGSAGLDFRAIRILRTETAHALGDREKEISKRPIYTGDLDWILDKNRDRWNCECTKLGGHSYNVNDPRIVDFPPHPGCACRLRPKLKSDDEIRAMLKEGKI
ncbi:hypothetical protein NO1_0584 [Candidatus Termititenax aidoneus]|uniref:Phage head morphogenesis domain-containing protein n=1 Tax=Termititenax aidoneus TaxID=2218524 RepID=A0A388TA69_TERA1|nr:hypothetical protein NO1_0584 [Candidatus Termititenax aidoneus]